MIERWILARLRHRLFYSLAKLNAAIHELFARLNQRATNPPARCHPRQPLEELDRPELNPLPSKPYVFTEWRAQSWHRLPCR